MFPSEHRLERDGTEVMLGMRAFDLLVALAENAGETITKRNLLEVGWPGLHVEEGNLRVQIAKLRRALSDGADGVRYIENSAGRGYSFNEPVVRTSAAREVADPKTGDEVAPFPPPPTRMVGRESDVRAIVEALSESTLVTLVGAGGIGKTMVAVSVGHALAGELHGAVCFVDLASISDPNLITAALARALGVPLPFQDPTPVLATFFAANRHLVILDNCEHLIDDAARFAEQIASLAPEVRILATSREALRVSHELVYRLPTLASPPEGSEPSAEEAMAFAAVEMFVSRISDTISGYKLTDLEAPRVSELCRRLDGVALAVELVAARVGMHGMAGVEELLADGLNQISSRPRAAFSRHQTLEVMLDWSYALLTDVERMIYRRLGVFVGRFTLAEASSVAGDVELKPHEIANGVGELVAKSLVAVSTIGAVPIFRLLHTTREHARRKLRANGEAEAAARWHARHYLHKIEAGVAACAASARRTGLAPLVANVDEVRAALDWSFSQDGDAELAVRLAAASGAVFLELSLLAEGHGWTRRGLALLRDAQRGGRTEMQLLASFALSLLFSKGNTEEVGTALRRGVEIAHQIGDRAQEARLLGGLYVFHFRIADHPNALLLAKRAVSAARASDDARTMAIASWILGCAHHLVGDHHEAIRLCASALEGEFDRAAEVSLFGLDHRIRALCALGRSLWLVGRADEAERIAAQTMLTARRLDHPGSLSIALIWTIQIHFWTGNLQLADARINELIAHTERHAHAPYRALGVGMRGQLLARRGQHATAEQLLAASIDALEIENHRVLLAAFKGELARCLAHDGRRDEALQLVDAAIAETEVTSDLQHLPDLLSAKAEILVSSAPRWKDWASWCEMAIKSAAGQSAIGLQLRAALFFVDLQARTRQQPDLGLVADLIGGFQEGFETADLIAAKRWLTA
jgi:predicted ATPase/DNA-binding winged helix-turn-helix (wHTH) protein